MGFLIESLGIDPSVAFHAKAYLENGANGKEPRLGGELREKAVWVDESTCIGCRYCSNVASNSFVLEPDYGRSRAIRQDGDSTEIIQLALDNNVPLDKTWSCYSGNSKPCGKCDSCRIRNAAYEKWLNNNNKK